MDSLTSFMAYHMQCIVMLVHVIASAFYSLNGLASFVLVGCCVRPIS